MAESQDILNEKKRYFKVHTLLLLWCEIEQDNLNWRFNSINRFLLVELLLLFFNVFYREKKAFSAAPIRSQHFLNRFWWKTCIHHRLKCQHNAWAGVSRTGIGLRAETPAISGYINPYHLTNQNLLFPIKRKSRKTRLERLIPVKQPKSSIGTLSVGVLINLGRRGLVHEWTSLKGGLGKALQERFEIGRLRNAFFMYSLGDLPKRENKSILE